ncbi:MAG TPA: allantoate amidohydrolase [Xanthobacteraceae bacterium]|nr:allantoate amidohydrolase [Xanthobacteraceae bacterium]
MISSRPGANNFGPRIMQLADHLAQWSEQEGALTVTYFSPAHKRVAAELDALLRAAGMDVRTDPLGNVIGRYPSGVPGAKTLLVGSHYDTVRDGGKYDGRLGILLPLALIEHLHASGQRLPFNIELLCFSEEEGVRFPVAYLGSQAIAGKFDAQNLDKADDNGVPLRKVLEEAAVDVNSLGILARDPSDLIGYVEVHIEQGPSLLNANLPVAIVTGIAGDVRHRIAITGEAGHAGTVAMQFRHDAAAAAAEMVLAVEKRCSGQASLVGTVGQLIVPNGAMNVIPGRCEFSTDIRAATNEMRDAAVMDVLVAFNEISRNRGVKVEATEVLRMPAIPLSPFLQERLAASAKRLGVEPLLLPSGAGHDAAMMASLCESAMMFVRCGNGGVSHSPREIITEDDADFAARVLFDFLVSLADEYVS